MAPAPTTSLKLDTDLKARVFSGSPKPAGVHSIG